MNRTVAGRTAWSLWSVGVLAAIAVVAFAAATPEPTSRHVTQIDLLNSLVALLMLSWSTTGAIVASRRPTHPIGWLLLFVALAAETETLAGAYAGWAHQAETAAAVPAEYLALFGDVLWIPSLVCSATLVPLLFPDGRLPSRRWRPVLWAAVGAACASVPATVLLPGPLHYLPETPNPLGVDALGGALAIVGGAATATALLCSLAAIVGVAARYRRAVGTMRMQLRWFVAALLALAVSVPPAAIFDDTAVGSVLFDVFWALPPIAIGVAVLRYRLYEIDRIISRTLAYAAVSAVLLAVYSAVATLPGAVFNLDSDLLVAAATLAAAALFVPVRRHVQAAVDRRFNRARYDAARVVERFGVRLRDDLDVAHLTDDLRRVIAATMQPDHVSLWLLTDRT